MSQWRSYNGSQGARERLVCLKDNRKRFGTDTHVRPKDRYMASNDHVNRKIVHVWMRLGSVMYSGPE